MGELFPWSPLRWTFGAVLTVVAVVAAGHALLNKREPRSALGWIAICLMFPLAGPSLYYVFGINRIRTRAKRLHAEDPEAVTHGEGIGAPDDLHRGVAGPAGAPHDGPVTAAILRSSDIVTGLPRCDGNRVVPLRGGDLTYSTMVAAIEQARESVYLASYIFDPGRAADDIVGALRDAVRRRVRTRVLIDGVGELYGRPRISRKLARAGVPVARFLPPRLVPPQFGINLRNHRKILVVDGTRGLTGGMNIRDCHLRSHPDPHVDLHCEVSGPVVSQLERVFRDDWAFVTGERLPASVPHTTEACGETMARAIVDGPDEDLDKLATILIGAVSAANERVWITTPYFLPPRELIGSMKSAALRGVDVSVILPGKNNLPPVHWAARNTLWELLHWGVRVFYQPPPFAHTKLLILDRDYLQLGSANLDPRSLRLNFELSLEIVDAGLNAEMARYFEDLRERSTEITVTELQSRPLWIRMRDAAAWLFSPYL